jgi:hypothetical protein
MSGHANWLICDEYITLDMVLETAFLGMKRSIQAQMVLVHRKGSVLLIVGIFSSKTIGYDS